MHPGSWDKRHASKLRANVDDKSTSNLLTNGAITMRKILLVLALLLCSQEAHAQQVVALCSQVAGANGMPASCVPVSATNPLPATMGATGFTNLGTSSSATSPRVPSTPNTGLYTSAAGHVNISIGNANTVDVQAGTFQFNGGNLNNINTTGNAVITNTGHQQSGGGAYFRTRDDTLGTMGYVGENSAINGGTVFNQFDIQNPQAAGTVCISGNANASSSAGPTGCDLFINATNNVVVGTFGTATATTVCQNAGVLSACSSALRFKDNVINAKFGLLDVAKFRPVYFDWKDKKVNVSEQHDFGLIAEDVASINPIFATYDKDGQIMGVKYERLTVVLIGAVKELTIAVIVLFVLCFLLLVGFIELKLKQK